MAFPLAAVALGLTPGFFAAALGFGPGLEAVALEVVFLAVAVEAARAVIAKRGLNWRVRWRTHKERKWAGVMRAEQRN